MSTRNDQDTQAFIEQLYERSGRTNGLYTGLYQHWARATLRKQRKIELDSDPVRSWNPRASWVSRYFGTAKAETEENTCADG